MNLLKCKKCQSSNYVKAGNIRGLQRYKCKDCSCQFTPSKPRGVNPVLKSLAIILYSHCGVSMGNIAKMFRVSTVAVLKWIRQAASQIKETPQESAEVVMVDEFWSFVDGKKTKFGCGEPLTGYRVHLSDTSWVIVLTPTSRNLSKK